MWKLCNALTRNQLKRIKLKCIWCFLKDVTVDCNLTKKINNYLMFKIVLCEHIVQS